MPKGENGDAPMSVLLTSTTNAFEARVIAARLESEGLEPDLRGSLDGPYPFMVGAMAEIGVWVPEDQLEDARLVMLATEIDDAVGAHHPPAPPRWTLLGRVVIGATVATMLVVIAVRAVSGY